MIKNCVICGGVFEAPSRAAVCSDECRRIHRRNRERGNEDRKVRKEFRREQARPVRFCGFCGTQYRVKRRSLTCGSAPCKKKLAAEHASKSYRSNIERVREYSRNRYKDPDYSKHKSEIAKEWAARNRDKVNATSRAGLSRRRQSRRNLEIAKLICSVGGLST